MQQNKHEKSVKNIDIFITGNKIIYYDTLFLLYKNCLQSFAHLFCIKYKKVVFFLQKKKN